MASSENFWALIMDAGTGYCSQVYELSQLFLNKVHYDLFLSLCPSLPLSPDSSLCMFAGVDYGAVGEELSHNSSSWSNQWKFLGCNVQRFVDYLFFTKCYSNYVHFLLWKMSSYSETRVGHNLLCTKVMCLAYLTQ